MRVEIKGDLGAALDAFVGSFSGGLSPHGVISDPSGFESFTASSRFPYGASVLGPSLDLPSAGPEFLVGTVTRFELAEVILGDNMRVVDRLAISGFATRAEALFDLVGRTDTTARGRFEEDAFRDLLDQGLRVDGSKGSDVVAPGRWAALDGADAIVAGRGHDRVEAGAGHDTVVGGAGDDRLAGGGGRDRVTGGDGRDRLNGGGGDDLLSGGSGADVFVFARGSGRDVVTDFDLRRDRIDLPEGLAWEVEDAADGARVVFAGGSAFLQGVDAAALTDEHIL